MWYLGGKIRLSKYIVPIIENYINENTLFIDLFCGGCNVSDKITKTKNIICNDHNKYLIEMWKYLISTKYTTELNYSKEEYDEVKNNRSEYEDWYVGLIGFHYSYGGKFFGGYARSRYSDHIERSINKTIKQSETLKDFMFTNKDYKEYSCVKNAVIYCDPPYKNSTQRSTKYNSDFNYEEFYDWCREMSRCNVVIISEKYMPDDFDIIWEKEHNSNMSYNSATKSNEKLYVYKKNLRRIYEYNS